MSNLESVTAEDFARHVANTNPFTQDRVTQATQRALADVGAIHDDQFKKLIRRINEVRRSGQTHGILLTGQAGVGKSHVLARLFRWANEEGNATAVYLHNILSSPERTARYLLHATVNELAGFRPANFADSDLYKLINLAIGARLDSRSKGAKRKVPNLNARKEILTEIGHEIDPDQLVMPVFIRYLEHAMGANLAEEAAEVLALAAVQWLSGEVIEPERARSIGLRVNSEDGACIPDDVAVQRVFDVLCRLCACAKRPFVLCLDQVDNLSEDRVKALFGFLHAAIDNGHNLVVIVSGVWDSIQIFRKNSVISAAAYDRIAQAEIELKPISIKQAREIVQGRVAQFSEPFAEVKSVAKARKHDDLAPLSSEWWKKHYGKLIETRPRDAIRAARDAWDGEQERLSELGEETWLKQLGKGENVEKVRIVGRPLEERIDELVRLKVIEAFNQRKLNPARLPPDADNLATLTHTLLTLCIGEANYTIRSVGRVGKAKASTYDLWVTEKGVSGEVVNNGLIFFTSDNALSATNALKRLKADHPAPEHQILVTDEERRPLRPGVVGLRHYEELKGNGRFEHAKLSFGDHAQLDALSSVLGAARVGDLDVENEPSEYRPITEAECRASMHRLELFINHPLLRLLLTEEREPTSPSGVVDKEREKQVRVQIKGELALALGMTAREMAKTILERTSQSNDAFVSVWNLVKLAANHMHQEKELYVDAVNDDLFLQLRTA
ncbi:MAG TPA: AAA family ATPase [Polyangiaceae bacterium]|jgi:Cdc6-like AAA superfamily ATPase|nr:AAA family ATPase [Polyangiaceae bacterium]